MTVPHSSQLIGIAIAGFLFLSACSDDSDDHEAFNLVEDNKLTICSEVPYNPFEFEDPEAPSGYSGFDMDLMQAIADGLGLEMTVDVVGFDPLVDGTVFSVRQCDVGASAITINDERKADLNFSEPYYDSLQSILVTGDSDISSITDLAGKTVGVQQGSTGEAYARENLPDSANAQPYPGDSELLPALKGGTIDAILQDFPVNDEHAQENANYEVVETFETDEQYGFVFGKDEPPDLREAVNAQLAELRENGTYDEIYDKYFAVE